MSRAARLTRSLALGLVLLALSLPALADSTTDAVWVAARDLPRGALLAEEDVRVERRESRRTPSDASRADSDAIVGMQLRRSVREGRVLRDRWLEPASTVKRGQVVRLVVRSGGLQILGKGRAVSDGAVGERIRVVNLDSRREIVGRVARDGSVHVGL